jgi:hypothetical protein
MKEKLLSSILMIILSGCTDEYIISLPDTSNQVVIDGWIRTDQPPYVMVSSGFKPGTSFSFIQGEEIKDRSIENAVVILSDDLGNKDTLVYRAGYSYYTWKEIAKASTETNPNHIILQPGHRYFLSVSVGSQNYTANSFMEPAPVIENISYTVKKGEIGKEDQHIPLISFTKIQGKEHYYLFSIFGAYNQVLEKFRKEIQYGIGNNSRVWSASVISDLTLPDEVKDLSLDDGASIARYTTWYPNNEGGITVYMYSITKESSDYYKALLQQFDNDGGVYSPSPTTPSGNISNGAIGLFQATDVSAAQVLF